MWIPTKIYEALPAIYFVIGVAMICGTAYIGINRGPMLGYLVLGFVCISASILVARIRHSVRSGQDGSRT